MSNTPFTYETEIGTMTVQAGPCDNIIVMAEKEPLEFKNGSKYYLYGHFYRNEDEEGIDRYKAIWGLEGKYRPHIYRPWNSPQYNKPVAKTHFEKIVHLAADAAEAFLAAGHGSELSESRIRLLRQDIDSNNQRMAELMAQISALQAENDAKEAEIRDHEILLENAKAT